MSGYVRLAGDSAIEFESGEITSLAAGSHLGLVGNDAFIEDSTAPGKNSALAGLTSIGAGALFALHDGATVSTTGALANDGKVTLDPGVDDGGSSLMAGGTLTNSYFLGIGNTTLSASDKVTAAALDNTGKIYLTGSSANQALLDVAGSAGFGTAGVLSGHVVLAGDSAIEFKSGQITSLAAKAQLLLDGNNAFIEDSTAPGSNGALAGLASIGSSAAFGLGNGASVSTTGSLTNNGFISVVGGASLSVVGTLTNSDEMAIVRASLSTTGGLVNDGRVYLDSDVDDGGSSLTVAGTLTNRFILSIGDMILSASDTVTAGSLDNTGSVDLAGDGPYLATLDVSGATTNDGDISISDGAEELAGAVGGAGSFSLANDASLQFGSSVSSGQTINEFGAVRGALILEQAQSFAATISGFVRSPRRHDRRGELSLFRNDVQFRREFGGHGRHAHADRQEPEFDRQHPDVRRLFEVEFHPRSRPRDRHAGEVRRADGGALAGLALQSW